MLDDWPVEDLDAAEALLPLRDAARNPALPLESERLTPRAPLAESDESTLVRLAPALIFSDDEEALAIGR